MRRRDIIAAAAVLLSLSAAHSRAEQLRAQKIGFLSAAPLDGSDLLLLAFVQGVRELGWASPGQEIKIEIRSADGQFERLEGLASDQRLPAVYPFRLFFQLGGLMSYGG